ncbi:hypothetical protein HC761_02045 [bacterium]|nr:hypothetical protein [bacterium]
MLWFAALQALDIEQVERALQRHIQCPDAGQFPPKPADVLRHAQGNSAANAALAWGRVVNAMARVGAYQSVDFNDAAIHAAVRDLGGWPLLCASPMEERPFFQKRFEAAFKAYAALADFEAPSELPGLTAQDWVLAGLPPPEPVLIAGVRSVPRLGHAVPQIEQVAQLLEMPA